MHRLLAPRTFALLFFLILVLLHHAVAQPSPSEPCVPHNRSVPLRVHIRLLYAGSTPIFMRESWTSDASQRFLAQLSGIIRHRALPFPDDFSPLASLMPKQSIDLCSVLEISHTYSLAVAASATAAKLDAALAAALKRSSSIFASGPVVADAFHTILESDPTFAPSTDAATYNLLLYNAASVAPQRGYVAEQGAPARTVGVATSKRFAFLDVGAKPHFLDDSASSTPGEQLMAASREPDMYANNLRAIAAKLFTPSASSGMMRYPEESRLMFSLKLVDVSAVIGRRSGIAGDSLANKAIGSTFSSDDFESMIRSVFHASIAGEKQISVEVKTPNMVEDATIAMAVARAFSMRGLQMLLDSDQLMRDIIANETARSGYFVDSSFVAHVPLYLFSFADDSRVTHFKTGEELRAKVVGKSAVFMIENRLRDAVEKNYMTTTSEAVKEVLELLCGVTRNELGYVNATNGVVPLLFQDVVRRNILRQELDWSEYNAARKAEELLDFEGLDSRLIPHEKGSAIAESRISVKQSLRSLYKSWDRAAAAVSVGDIESMSLGVMRNSRQLADKLHDEICNQPLSEEILLRAEAETEELELPDNARPMWLLYLITIYFPVVLGILFGTFCHWRMQRKVQARSVGIGEIPVVSPRHSFEPPSTGLWFSTMTSSDKSKVH